MLVLCTVCAPSVTLIYILHPTFMQALGLLCETVRDHETAKRRHKGRRDSNSQWQLVDGSALNSFQKLCEKIVGLVDDSADSSSTLKLAAVLALEVLANSFPSNHSSFSGCLASVTKNISSHDLAVSSSSLRTTGALVNVLGPRSLPELPSIMENVIKISDVESKQSVNKTHVTLSTMKEPIVFSVLVVLEAVVDKLGGFLNPYLGDVIKVLVLHPDYVSGSDLKLKLKADTVRRLVSEKIPVSLMKNFNI